MIIKIIAPTDDCTLDRLYTVIGTDNQDPPCSQCSTAVINFTVIGDSTKRAQVPKDNAEIQPD